MKKKIIILIIFFSTKGISQSLTIDETIRYLNDLCAQHPGFADVYTQVRHLNDSCKTGVFYKISYDKYYNKLFIQEFNKSYDCPNISNNSTRVGNIYKLQVKDFDENNIELGLEKNSTTIIIKGSIEKQQFNYAKNYYESSFPDSLVLTMIQANYKNVLYNGLKYLVSIAKEQIPKEVDEVVEDPFLKKETTLHNQSSQKESKIALIEENGVFSVRVAIGDKFLSKFVLDSGAGECNISSDLEKKLIEAGIIKRTDYLSSGLYKLADGRIIESKRVRISNISIGSKKIKNVIVSLGPSNSPNLLGQSFLNRLESWSIDNSKKILIVR